jgi:SAM-dependent methyltransferase
VSARTIALLVCLVASALSTSLAIAQPRRTAPPMRPAPRMPTTRPGLPGAPIPPEVRDQPRRKDPTNRLFRQQDLGLLEAPDRDQWQKPDQIMDALGIAEGSTVADLGAAGGWFTLRLATRVGPNGLVYAEDIQPGMIEGIARRMKAENLANVKPILGTPTDPRLPPGLDAALISDAYHEMDDPADPSVIVTLLRNIGNALKPQGRLAIVDWTPGAGGPGPPANQRVDPAAIIKAAEAAGLRLISREEIPPFVYLLVFGRAANARAVP